ncbi:uncharacterized protein LOC124176033 [Neodiprion fabricii]|uniref:uncharacterized protein LOC124176033 n=1 Tax=Neodiprion fabricii TaxID=2872261 RepID=UPI001ED8D2EC|nr:uncharacterized protein LOC124176033 [Neodiprion fabricii]
MANLTLFLLIVICACVFVNAQDSTFGQKQNEGQTFEEVIVSSDLNVRRKSKENRQGKQLLTNIPLATVGKTGSPTVSRLISNDGSRVELQKRNRRSDFTKNRLNLGAAEYLLHSSK